jgi:hypothetical protein
MLAFILSQPRSGSTVLSAMLDRRKGVVCLPESSFPQVLGAITKKERQDKRWLAALYLGSTLPPLPKPPTPLTLNEVEDCIRGEDEEILYNIGHAVAKKLGRKANEITHVVWKTTRTPGLQSLPQSLGGKFVILRRCIYNVYLSQFSVQFGEKNRNPLRFALVNQSYEHAFSKLRTENKYDLRYDEIPNRFEDLCEFLQIMDRENWLTPLSTIHQVSKDVPWLKDSTKPFVNNDEKKLNLLSDKQKNRLRLCLNIAQKVRFLLGPVRTYYDNWSLNHARYVARMHIDGLMPS